MDGISATTANTIAVSTSVAAADDESNSKNEPSIWMELQNKMERKFPFGLYHFPNGSELFCHCHCS